MGNTGGYVTMCVKIPRELRERMDRLSRELGIRWSDVVRELLVERVAELERLAKLSTLSRGLPSAGVERGFAEGATVMIRDSARRLGDTQVRG